MEWVHWTESLNPVWLVMPALVASVLLARVLLRGTWKEIAQAYGIWLTLWFVFGLAHGLASGSRGAYVEGFGLAIMWGGLSLLPLVGIPILVLLLKLVSYFKPGRRASHDTASLASARRPFALANIRQWSRAEWATLVFVCGFFAALKLLGAPSNTEKQQLRVQFHLPEDVAISKVYLNRSSAKHLPAAIEGYVQLSEAQFGRYVAELASRSVWRPSPIMHGGTEFHGPYAPEALTWRDLKSARQVGWGSLSDKPARDARNGRVICFTVRDEGNGYRGVPCPAAGSPTVRAVIVQGLLDFDTRTLHMLIRQTRP